MSDCEQYLQWMDEAIDSDLDQESTQQLEAHLVSCPSCRQQMNDLRSLVSAAANLRGEIEPGRDLWPDIEDRIEGRPEPRRSMVRLALAVAAILVVGIGLIVLRAPDTRPQIVSSEGSGIVAASNRTVTLDGVRHEYGEARAELLEVVNARRDEISPETLQVIESNLALIDSAIDDIEKALAANPGEGRLDRHLQLAYARQIELLRWAARMPSQT